MKFVLMLLIGTIFLFDVSTGYTDDVLNKKIVDDKKGFYMKGGMGVTQLENYKVIFSDDEGDFHQGDEKYKEGFTLNGGIGKEFKNGVAVELELNYQKSDADHFGAREFTYKGITYEKGEPFFDGDTSIKTLMVNLIYNLKNSSVFTPYIGVGSGIAWIDIQTNAISTFGKLSETNLSYQALAGVETEIDKNFSVLTGYRYLDAGEIGLKDGISLTGLGFFPGLITRKLKSHSVEVAIKYSF